MAGGRAILLDMSADPDHPFSVRTVPCTDYPTRFRWEIDSNGRPREYSTDSYPTEPMAAAAGQDAMEALVEKWRSTLR